MARRSPNFSPRAPNSGCPKPQARFWIAIARENSDRAQPKCSATGIWKTPKLARMPKLAKRMMHPATRIGASGEVLAAVIGRLRAQARGRWIGGGRGSKINFVAFAITRADGGHACSLTGRRGMLGRGRNPGACRMTDYLFRDDAYLAEAAATVDRRRARGHRARPNALLCELRRPARRHRPAHPRGGGEVAITRHRAPRRRPRRGCCTSPRRGALPPRAGRTGRACGSTGSGATG